MRQIIEMRTCVSRWVRAARRLHRLPAISVPYGAMSQLAP